MSVLGPKASKASMAQSLVKKLDKIDRIEIDVEDTATHEIEIPCRHSSQEKWYCVRKTLLRVTGKKQYSKALILKLNEEQKPLS